MSGFAPSLLLALGTRVAMRIPQRNVNTVTTNVPGPQKPLYACGRPMLEAFPFVPLASSVRIGVAIFSYNGMLNYGVTGDYDTAPDIAVLCSRSRSGNAGAAEAQRADTAKDRRPVPRVGRVQPPKRRAPSRIRNVGRSRRVHCVQAHHGEVRIGRLEREHRCPGATQPRDLTSQCEASQSAHGLIGRDAYSAPSDRHRRTDHHEIQRKLGNKIGVRRRVHATVDIANPVDGHRSEEGRNGTRSRDRGGDIRHSTRVAPERHAPTRVQRDRIDPQQLLGPTVEQRSQARRDQLGRHATFGHRRGRERAEAHSPGPQRTAHDRARR